jgi:hypothetical protein
VNTVQELKTPLRHEFIGKEKDFEDYIYENMDEICEGLGLPGIFLKDRQRMIHCGNFQIKPDILVRHTDETMTIFEVKKANEKYPSTGTFNQVQAIGQLLLYRNVVESIIHAPVRLALIDNKIYYRTFCAFLGNELPITLIELQNDRIFVPYNAWG